MVHCAMPRAKKNLPEGYDLNEDDRVLPLYKLLFYTFFLISDPGCLEAGLTLVAALIM